MYDKETRSREHIGDMQRPKQQSVLGSSFTKADD